MGLFRPLVDKSTLLRYAMGESACAVARRRPELVGRAVPVAVLNTAECGACPDVVLRAEAPPSLEVVLAPPTTSRGLFPGFTIQPLGDGPLLAFPAGAAPPQLPLIPPRHQGGGGVGSARSRIPPPPEGGDPRRYAQRRGNPAAKAQRTASPRSAMTSPPRATTCHRTSHLPSPST